jgi:hypothetical protein
LRNSNSLDLDTLQILSQDTKNGDRPGLYVQITGNSPNAGKKGWTYSLGLSRWGPVAFYVAIRYRMALIKASV